MVSPSLDGLTNVIVSVDWCVTAEDEKTKITAYRYGGPVALGAPSPAAFTPFEQTKLADIVGWYQAAMGEKEVDSIIKGLDDEIEAKVKAAADPSTPVPMALTALESK